jgi:hypothetical protein
MQNKYYSNGSLKDVVIRHNYWSAALLAVPMRFISGSLTSATISNAGKKN